MMGILKVFGIIFLAIFCLVVLINIGESTTPKAKFVEEIIKDDRKLVPLKRSVDVRLKQKISSEDLLKLGNQIKGMESRECDRTFISYYLPGMKPGAGHWASTHYEGNRVQVDIAPR